MVILGTDKKVKYFKSFGSKASQSDIDTVVPLVEGLVK
jgi:hypothetical protein